MKTLTQKFSAWMLVLLVALLPAQIAAQEAPDQEELETFTEAYIEIAEIREEVTPELAAAETPEEANEIQQQANERMTEILEERDMTVERYASITNMLNTNQELRARFEEIHAEMTSPGR